MKKRKMSKVYKEAVNGNRDRPHLFIQGRGWGLLTANFNGQTCFSAEQAIRIDTWATLLNVPYI